jgi:endoglucanase
MNSTSWQTRTSESGSSPIGQADNGSEPGLVCGGCSLVVTTKARGRESRIVMALLAGVLFASAACDSTRQDDSMPRPAPLQGIDALIRVDQVGYASGETKTAVLLAPRTAAGARVAVIDEQGETVMAPVTGRSRGVWNARFSDVRPIDLTSLTKPGTYRLRVEGPVTAESPPFRVGNAAELFGPLAQNSVQYFQAHRDGAAQVAGPWRRQPAHLADRQASVYDSPSFDKGGRMTATLTRAGGPVDVEGGWYDAGDFLKFTHTTAYALIALLLVQRDGLGPAGLDAETRHGVDWLDKMWDADTETLYTQVGIGSGLNTGDQRFLGDHDTWRLPQDDDRLDVTPGDGRYYQRHRPVFRAAGPGEALSPNLAGRVAAAFALAAQVEAAGDPVRAKAHLAAASQIFDLAETGDVGQLVTAEPRSFYPEDSWADDLAAGATELALAGRSLGDPRAQDWARQATHWAKANAEGGSTADLSVYDLSAVADAELARALTATPVAGAEIDVAGLGRDMRRRLDAGVEAAAGNPVGAAAGSGGSDYAARQLGYTAAAELYEHLTGDGRYAAFATAQRGVTLGANGWGTSLIVGAGTTYPRCPHDQIASLTAGAAASGMVGAVVNGPNAAKRIHELIADPSPSPCGSDTFAVYDRDDTHYTDDVRVSANTEPSIDFTATGLLAFALTAKQH